MADVTRLPGVFEQIRLVTGVRWLMVKHALRKKNNVWDLIGMIWVAIFCGLLVFGLSFAFFFGGYEFLAKNRPGWLSLLYWAIFLWWQVFPIFVAGFGSTFEFASLLRFPLSLRAFYLLGLGYGITDFAAVAAICWTVSVMAGAAAAKLSILPRMALVSLFFILMNLAMERLVGSWVEKLMATRRMRELFMALFVGSMVSLNFLNPVLQRWGHGAQSRTMKILPYIGWTPGSLAGNAVAASVNGNLRNFLVYSAGLLAWTVIAGGLLWRRFAALYSGEVISESAAPSLTKRRVKRHKVMARERPGLVSPQVAAMVLKEFRYLTRNGFAFLQLLLPPILVLFFSYQFGPGSPLKEHSLKPAMFFPAILAYLMLILLSPAYNSFAFESKGILSYYTAPVRFRDVLLGKNLFLLSLVTFELALAMAVLTVRLGWPGGPVFASTILGGVFAVVGQLAIANWSSLSFPKKMELGKMKGQRNSGVAVWTAFGVQIVLMGIGALILLIGYWTGSQWFPSLAFAALAVASVSGYVASLSAMDGLAEKKKEVLIEALTR